MACQIAAICLIESKIVFCAQIMLWFNNIYEFIQYVLVDFPSRSEYTISANQRQVYQNNIVPQDSKFDFNTALLVFNCWISDILLFNV
jgi:hypothetical protein